MRSTSHREMGADPPRDYNIAMNVGAKEVNGAANAGKRISLLTLLLRALRLACPLCGKGRLFKGWLRMPPHCSECGFRFERSAGYWLGSIYVNYGLTALIVTGGYFALFFSEAVSQTATLWILTAFCLLFPVWFFRFARAIWIALDVYFDPPQSSEFELADSAAEDS
ncbi:MAG TPA: DUF983 domain-containing protein [Pirellulales bacterium]